MKRILSLITVIAVIASALIITPLHTSAAGDTLTITSHGQVLGEVEVGSVFIYHVALDSAGYSPFSGQGELRYDSKYVKVVEHGEVMSSGKINMDAYSFPKRIRNSSLVTNYYALNNKQVAYNFAKGNAGVGVFTTDDHYMKVRFKAIAPGTVEIRHYMTTLTTMPTSSTFVKLITNDKGNVQLDPIPYTLSSIETAAALVGDANGDFDLTVLDATFIQRAVAGVSSTYSEANADVNRDGTVDLRDALDILRYKAGMATDTNIGEWIFESEQEE